MSADNFATLVQLKFTFRVGVNIGLAGIKQAKLGC